MKEGLYTFNELSQYMDKSQEPLRELVKVSQEREKYLHRKVEEMQKALEWYADESNYHYTKGEVAVFSAILTDAGERARQALKGESQ